MNKTMITSFCLLMLNNVNAETFVIKMKNDLISNIIVEETIKYDENGFSEEGIHRDTGTNYDPEGYDKDGYDEFNVSKENCYFDKTSGNISYLYWKGNGYNRYEFYFQNNQYNASTSDNTNFTELTGNYLFRKGDLKEQDHVWGDKWEICVKTIKQV